MTNISKTGKAWQGLRTAEVDPVCDCRSAARTALHFSCGDGDTEMCVYLMGAGADYDIGDKCERREYQF